jgi:hypothetical protein
MQASSTITTAFPAVDPRQAVGLLQLRGDLDKSLLGLTPIE